MFVFDESRRRFLQQTGVLGLTLMAPSVVSCVRSPGDENGTPIAPDTTTDGLPLVRPEAWDPIAFNSSRGQAGAIPSEYMKKILGPEGVAQHLGKHLPYVPRFEQMPSGMLALMWGDPAQGYSRHPNAAPSESNPTGHWYNWIRLRRAIESATEEVESRYTSWPLQSESDNGRYGALTGIDPALENGENTVYLVVLPKDVQRGEWIRLHGHCLTHGEYVDFLKVPA